MAPQNEPSRTSVRHRVLAIVGDLAPQEQRAAHYLLDHLADAAAYSATELATAAGVSKATMSRLSRSLGFTSFAVLREQLRAASRVGAPQVSADFVTTSASAAAAASDSATASGTETLIARHVDAATRQINALALFADDFATIAQRIINAPRVVIIGYRSSYPVALHLRQQLTQLRGSIDLLPYPGQTIAEDIVDLQPSDYVVVVALGRRMQRESMILTALQSGGTAVALFGDRSARSLSSHAETFVELGIETPGAMTSLASAMSAMSIIVNTVAVRLSASAQQRVDAISDTYMSLNELEVEW